MTVHDLPALAAGLAGLDLDDETTHEEAMAFPVLGSLNGCEIGMARFRGQPPWEKHPDDELLHIVAGELQLTLFRDGAAEAPVTLTQGDLFVVPAGTWHRSFVPDGVTVLFATSKEGNERAFGESPEA